MEFYFYKVKVNILPIWMDVHSTSKMSNKLNSHSFISEIEFQPCCLLAYIFAENSNEIEL